MKTQAVARPPQAHDPGAVSRALQELSPRSLTIVDGRGRPAELSLAGYVLRFGRSYSLRIITPFDESELRDVRIVAPPDFVKVDPEFREVDNDGRVVHSLPFRVGLELWPQLKRFGFGLRFDDLEIATYLQPTSAKVPSRFHCPIVVRPWLVTAIIAILLGVVLALLERLGVDVLLAGQLPDWQLAGRSLASWPFWVWFVGASALLMLLALLVNTALLYSRGRELRKHYRAAYRATT